jgi:hypothetical protein
MEEIDVVLNPKDYDTMPKYQLQELALAGDKKAERIYFERYGNNKSVGADIEKNNPNRDDRGRFTFGSGGPQGGGGAGGAGGAGEAEGGAGGSGGAGEPGEGKDITSELGAEYGTDGKYTQQSADLRDKDFDPGQKGDATLEAIAKKQGFDGKAEMVDQEGFDKVVAEGGTVTYRGITPHYDGPGPDATFIESEGAITNQFAEGEYFGGQGVYGSGTYTTTDLSIAQHYASEDGAGGSIVTMAVKPGARIASPTEWHKARQMVGEEKGGFTGASNEGRILAAQGFDGYRVVGRNSDDPASNFLVVINRKALVVLKK